MALKWGVLFSGQGAQKTGMGLDCYENSDVFRQVIDASSQELELDLVQIMQNEHGELEHTRNVQPALVAVSLGMYAMLKRDLPQIDIRASVGLSLGEYSALIASGKLLFKDGMKILKARAIAMEQDSQASKGKMFALVGPQSIDKVEEICRQYSDAHKIVRIANYNSPRQIVIGGNAAAVQNAAALIEQQKLASRVIELHVEGAFHTPLYHHTQIVLQNVISKTAFSDNTKHVLSNTTGSDFQTNTIGSTLVDQVVSPTHFGDCLKRMIDDDHIDATLEIGAGKALSSFARQIDPKLERDRITSYKNYCQFVEKASEKNWI